MAFSQIPQQASKSFFGSLFSFLRWGIKRWYLFIGIITLVTVIFMGVKDSFKHNDIGQLVFQLGSRIMSPDSTILLEVRNLKENPQITIEGKREYNSYWEKLKFKMGKYGSHIRIITSLVFLVGMFYLFYQGFNLISERKGVNLLLALLVMILLEMSFMLMIVYKDKTQTYPTMSQFLSTYSHLLYLVVFTVIVFLTFAIFNMQEASQTMMNMFYTIILGTLIFIFIGYLGVVNEIKDNDLTNPQIIKSIIPFRGVYNLISEWKLIIGIPVEKFMQKLPEFNENINGSVIDKSVVV